MNNYLRTATLFGRAMLGLFFLLPGIMKTQDWQGTIVLLEMKGVFFAPVFAGLATVTEITFGAALLLGYRVRISAGVLILFTLVVNVTLHNFWSMPGDVFVSELQLFGKNMGIVGGLLFILGMGGGQDSLSRHERLDPHY